MFLKQWLRWKYPLRGESGFESGNEATPGDHHLVPQRLFIDCQTVSQSRFPGLFVLFNAIGMAELGLLDLKERAYQVVHHFVRISLIYPHDRYSTFKSRSPSRIFHTRCSLHSLRPFRTSARFKLITSLNTGEIFVLQRRCAMCGSKFASEDILDLRKVCDRAINLHCLHRELTCYQCGL